MILKVAECVGWNTGKPSRDHRGWYWVCEENGSVAMLAEWSGFEWTFPYQEKLWASPVDFWVRVDEPKHETPKIQGIRAKHAV